MLRNGYNLQQKGEGVDVTDSHVKIIVVDHDVFFLHAM